MNLASRKPCSVQQGGQIPAGCSHGVSRGRHLTGGLGGSSWTRAQESQKRIIQELHRQRILVAPTQPVLLQSGTDMHRHAAAAEGASSSCAPVALHDPLSIMCYERCLTMLSVSAEALQRCWVITFTSTSLSAEPSPGTLAHSA